MFAGTYLALVASWLAAVALFASVERARSPTPPAGGPDPPRLVLFLPLLFAGKVAPGPLKLVVAVALGAPPLLALVGSAGLADKIGAGLPMPDDGARPWRRVLRGGAVLGLLFVIPGLGWFGVLPLVLASGLGTFVLSRWTTPPLTVPAPPAILGTAEER
jgi:hypothetical protein